MTNHVLSSALKYITHQLVGVLALLLFSYINNKSMNSYCSLVLFKDLYYLLFYLYYLYYLRRRACHNNLMVIKLLK